jgi:CxxC motif-containing protein (DUF1111 family)
MTSFNPLNISCVLAGILMVVADCSFAQSPVAGPAEAKSGFTDVSIESSSGKHSDPDNKKHLDDKSVFDEMESAAPNGLGPIYNAQSCRECHQDPVSGAGSQVTEHRAGHLGAKGQFENPIVKIEGDTIVGRTLINDRAICAEAHERTPETETVQATRLSLSILGDGYIEALADETLLKLRSEQCDGASMVPGICGFAVYVPILEAPDKSQRIGRFGWKDQHASLMSFAADAYLNEMGITNKLLDTEFTKVCNPKVATSSSDETVTEPNDQPDPKDHLTDLDHFAAFMRETAVPPRDESIENTPEAVRGGKLFTEIGCAVCHVSSLTTAPAGTLLNGGTYKVSAALGSKVIHPFSDFLLHDVGTGDGIVIAAPEHYGIAVTAYLNEEDDKRFSVEEALSLGLVKGKPNLMASLIDKKAVEQATASIESFVHPFYESSICTSRSESDKEVLGTSKKFSIGIQCSANKLRTPPLWGVRMRARLMHDGNSFRFEDAISRHQGEAKLVTKRFQALSQADRDAIALFLKSL